MFQPEENWKLVAQHMVSLPIFEIFPLSDPEDFDNWQDWAKDFTMIVNRKSVNMTPISSNMAIWWNNSNTAVPWTNDSLTTVPWTE